MFQLVVFFSVLLVSGGCATDKGPVLAGVYQTWDDVITRWVGQQKTDLYYELGPPQFHKEARDGMEELVWDMTLPSLPGQAEIYGTLPLYGGIDCRLFFFADAKGIIKAGHRVGCD
jgi:hypothetical protein